jgi:hypothetical protein
MPKFLGVSKKMRKEICSKLSANCWNNPTFRFKKVMADESWILPYKQ